MRIEHFGIREPPIEEIEHLRLRLPEDENRKKVIVFDMDETLIHCVEDIDTADPDIIIPIYFTGEDEPTHAGINIRPKIHECLREANKYFRVVVFTASE